MCDVGEILEISDILWKVIIENFYFILRVLWKIFEETKTFCVNSEENSNMENISRGVLRI